MVHDAAVESGTVDGGEARVLGDLPWIAAPPGERAECDLLDRVTGLDLRRFGGHPEARFELETFDGSAGSTVAGVRAAVLHGGV